MVLNKLEDKGHTKLCTATQSNPQQSMTDRRFLQLDLLFQLGIFSKNVLKQIPTSSSFQSGWSSTVFISVPFCLLFNNYSKTLHTLYIVEKPWSQVSAHWKALIAFWKNCNLIVSIVFPFTGICLRYPWFGHKWTLVIMLSKYHLGAMSGVYRAVELCSCLNAHFSFVIPPLMDIFANIMLLWSPRRPLTTLKRNLNNVHIGDRVEKPKFLRFLKKYTDFGNLKFWNDFKHKKWLHFFSDTFPWTGPGVCISVL